MHPRKRLWGLSAVSALALFLVAVPAGADESVYTVEPMTWEWNDEVVGTTSLLRTDDALHVRVTTSGLTPFDTVTMWIAKFDNPAACSDTPCPRPADVGNPDTVADLFFADGVVVSPDGTAHFSGSLYVGQTEGSLKAERGISDAIPLEDPYGAEVAVALHSHGPIQPDLLREQLTTFLGGCEVLTGVLGFAQGPEDMPDEVGECTTFQKSVHLVPGS